MRTWWPSTAVLIAEAVMARRDKTLTEAERAVLTAISQARTVTW